MRKRFGQINTALLLSLLVAPGSAPAAEQAGQSVAQARKPSPFRVGVTIDATSNLLEPGDVEHTADTKLWLAPSYKISDPVSVSGLFIVQKDLTGLKETHLIKSSLTARHKGTRLNPYLTLSPAVTVALPLTHNAVARESLITSVAVAPRIGFDLTPAGLDTINGFFDLSLSRGFHRYETQTTGRSNTQWRLTPWLVVNVGFLTDFTLQLSAVRATSWTYAGNSRGAFDLNEELSYAITSDVSVAIGHNNSGDVLAANGTDSNIGIYDERSSTVYTALSFSL
jgi:hypothetical protein